MARGDRLGRATARPQSGRLLCGARHRPQRVDLYPRALRCRQRRPQDSRSRLADRSQPSSVRGILAAMVAYPFATGAVIEGFRLDAQLDPGGMANFWRVSRADFDFPMVMKVPLLRRGEDPITIVGFEVEQMIQPRLTGPHVPRFVAAGDFERPYIVMEYISGRPVKMFLEKTPLPAEQVAEIGAKIAFALHEIHLQHVIHLDLKPSNVILRGNDAVLIDFGLSRHDQLPDLVQEEAEGPVGTGAYIAPEQVLGERADPRSDLFALGVILYLLATGK